MPARTDADLWTLNERFSGVLKTMVCEETDPAFMLVRALRHELAALTPEHWTRLIQRRYLLMDFNFMDPSAWQTAQARSHPATAWTGCVPRTEAVQLAQTLLSLVSRTLHAYRLPYAVAKFGLAIEVAEIIAALQMSTLNHIADIHVGWLRPRWDQDLKMLRRLLAAARSPDANAMTAFDELAAQALVKDFLAADKRAKRGK